MTQRGENDHNERAKNDDNDSQITRGDFLARVGGGAIVVAGASAGGSVFAAAASGGRAAVKAQGPLKVGFLAPVTGPVAPEGVGLMRGWTIAVDEINARGGVLGQAVKYFSADDQANPATATTAAKKMIQEKGVHVLFGTITGDTSIAVAAVANQARVPFFQIIHGGVPYCSKYFFKTGETPYQIHSNLMPFMVRKFGKRVAMVGSDYEFPRRYNKAAAAFTRKAGGRIVADEYSPLGTADWSQVIAKLKSAKSDVLVSCVVGGDAVAFLKQAKSFGLLAETEVTGILFQEYYSAIGDILNGHYFSLRYSDQIANQRNHKFVAQWRKRYKDTDPIPGVAGNAYAAAFIMAEAVNRAKSLNGTAIAEQVPNVRQDSLFGPGKIFYHRTNHYLSTDIYLQHIEKGGKFAIARDFGVITDPTKC